MTSAPRLHMRELRLGRSPNLENEIRAERFRRRNEARAGGLIVGVDDARLDAGAALDRDLGAEPDEFLDCLRACRDARFCGVRFRGDSNQHETFPTTVDAFAGTGCPPARASS